MARKKKKKKGGEEAVELNMTPMIDVCFNLLIFFMLTCNFKKYEGALDSYLPKDQGMSNKTIVLTPEDLKEIRINLDPNPGGGVLVKLGTPGPKQPPLGVYSHATLDQLCANVEAGLLSRRDSGGKFPPVVISGQEDVQFKFVMACLNGAKRAKVDKLRFLMPEGGMDQEFIDKNYKGWR